MESVIKIAKSSKATIVIKSTIPVGFTEQIQKKFNIKKLLFSPEFLREGQALKDNLYPSRIIVSYPGHLPKLKNKAKIFANMLKKASLKENVPVIITKSNEAEAIKLFANTYLALRVAYFNELDTFAAIKNLNTKDIINGVCADPRIGDFYNNPSFGYGGYCLPKDSKQLLANYSGVPQNIIQAIIQANQTRKTFIANEIIKSGAKIIGVYHLAMKSNSDNYRNSAILDIANILKQNNLEGIIYEPSIKDAEFSGFKVLNDFKEFEAKSELIIANRTSNEIIKNKLYTRDIFKRD